MTSLLNDLPIEILEHILSYLYQNKNKKISYQYHLNNANLNLINKEFDQLIKNLRSNLLIHEPDQVINYYWAKNLVNDY